MLPEGLALFEDAFTKEEEASILASIRADALRPDCGRMVRKYHDKAVEPRFHPSWDAPTTGGFPEYGRLAVARINERGVACGGSYRMITNLYAAGEIATAHVDRVYMGIRDVVVAVSLGASRVMRLKHVSSDKSWDIELPPRSAIRFSGFSRFQCSHAILPGAAERASLIFRFQEGGQEEEEEVGYGVGTVRDAPLSVSPTIKVAAVPAPPRGARTVFGHPAWLARMYGNLHGLTPATSAFDADLLFLETTGFGGMLAQFRAVIPAKPLRVYLWDANRMARSSEDPKILPSDDEAAAILVGDDRR